MSVVLNAADCVWVLARSDVNPQDGQVDRFEFNAVLLEILAGCRLVNDATPRDVDYIFETAACYCLDYDDAACCNGDDAVIYRAGKYPSSYLLGVCEFLESAVAFQCNEFTSSPVASIVIQPPPPSPALAPSPPTLDLDVITQVVIPWIVVWTILLLIVILLLVAIICMMACWRRGQLSPQQQQFSGEYRDLPPIARMPQQVAPAPGAATTVARGTIESGTENIYFTGGTSSGDRQRRRQNRDARRDAAEDDTDIEHNADRILSEMLATDRVEDDDAIIGSEVSTRRETPSSSSDTGIHAVDGTDMVEHTVMKQTPPHPSEAVSSPPPPPSPHSPPSLRQDGDTTMSTPPTDTEVDLLVSNDDLLNIVQQQQEAPGAIAPSPIPHIGDVLVTDDEGDPEEANEIVRVFSFSTNMDSFATPRNDDGALSTEDGSCGSIPRPDWDR